MPEHQTPLIATIAAGLMLAFVLGLIAQRLRVQPLVGYLLAGVMVGPYTPGFTADPALATELAEIGVILLMFGVGLHFSLKDLLSVGRIAIPGAVGQIAVATLMGASLSWALGWPPIAGLVFGLALSVASTVVLIRALQERHILETHRGRIAVGWLVVEDLAMVLALVLLPALAVATEGNGVPPTRILFMLLVTLAKVSIFVAIMLIVGRRVIPWLMHFTAHTGSRELFRLAVYAIALGVAYGAAHLFGVSFALGAFFAGMVLGESDLSQRAAEEAIPLRDAFAVLFFVSVGMLLDPAVFVEQPVAVIATIAIIVVGKSVAAYFIVRAFGHSRSTAFTVSASLAQIGEFSFILIGIGIGFAMVPKEARDLILAGAIVSIMLNPLIFTFLERLAQEKPDAPPARPDEPPTDLTPTTLTGHDIVVGYGRVGSLVGAGLRGDGAKMIVVEASDAGVARARSDGAEVLTGNAAEPAIIAALNLAGARRLYVTIPEPFEAGQIVEQARAANPKLDILARAHSSATVEHFEKLGANLIVLGETEIAHRMLERGRADTSPRSA
ncbi:YbaL family putative K(+) efflux transporter [Reyranella sp.]|jgi:CPA2 family monovalent cation:H+ antiporter-2|uniref:YbaL family putative K(+) efflux transporter n=1 Tax=Reyranella sp. TaxID=1929291 RepID=UPI000BCB4FCB|nr:YbaL family putative K(+) efflux transporter [Reyranella sp.]OYY46737.1 MAG: Kef family K(+) transporter [Rhodospirillales bacterium 35-66-84]OYZ96757.1 MAG: Kef family K(+) transporter [Rhodospirillales bacterium 24-66-33]OZB27916.1 MAG: Kef family K(+) transporter [Rhodospirillales bacterium 39-66-50]HQS13641.1 YbaL family putative K(+) efflux transporter [Reyranella sp.]HQT10126.1 YbaL family putative K(+) efflux transporter [Reyranella sp.]